MVHRHAYIYISFFQPLPQPRTFRSPAPTSLTLVAHVPSFLKQRHVKVLRQMVSLDVELACGSRAVEEGTWAYFLLSVEGNEQCFSRTVCWWGALVQK